MDGVADERTGIVAAPAAPIPGAGIAGIAVFDTTIGTCGIAWGPAGLTGVALPARSAQVTRSMLTARHLGASEQAPPPAVLAVIDRIQGLLAGTGDDLTDVALDMSAIADFPRRVYDVARTIAPGSTTTYGAVARAVGAPGAGRAVGRALGANPFPIVVPCHRVLGADGSIGGFSAPGGAFTKRRMLLLEGADEQQGAALFGPAELYQPSRDP